MPGTGPHAPDADPRSSRGPRYLRLLLVVLVTASFFDGYDSGIAATVPGAIQDTFGLTVRGLGTLRFAVSCGAVFSFFVARSADRFGRRAILVWSVVAYTVMTGLTAVTPNVVLFGFCQFCAAVFLGSEYAVAVTMIVEEFPADGRGRALGLFTLMGAAGLILVPILAQTPLARGPLEWRALYLVGLLPLVLTSVLRRRVRETRLFMERKAEADAAGVSHVPSFFEPWKPPYRRTMVVLAFVTFCRSFPVFGATAWWVWYAEREAGLPQTLVLNFLIGAYGLGIIGYYVCGRAIDTYGRKPTAVTFGVVAWAATTVLFQTRAAPVQAVCVALAVFFGLGISPAINAFYTELFPTRIRASAAAWARNAFEIPGIISAPLIIGILGDQGTGSLGSVGDAVTVVLPLILVSVVLVWRYLPETKGRDLELLDAA